MKFEEGNIFFNKIYVIQSIPDKEKQTGTELYDDIISRRAWTDPNLATELVEVRSRGDFFNLLEHIKEETKAKKILPFIHFETHGTEEGISLNSDEVVNFSEFIPTIREINIYSGNNLFISVGACWGGKIQFETDLTKPCPFRGFIGPMDKIFPNDIVISFTSFFDELLTSHDFEKAIDRLNIYNNSGVDFHHFNSESFFDKVIDNQKKKYENNPKQNIEFIKSVAKKAWKSDPRVKEIYKTKGRFVKMVKRIEKERTPLIYEIMRENFLHVKIKNDR
jgi:hypothetical protein